MRNLLLAGAIAGAVGTLALDVTTYLDMVVRGRPSSTLPAEAAGRLAAQLHLPLGRGEQADNRKSALGSVLGYATGVSVAVVYGTADRRRRLPAIPAGLLLGVAAMAAADAPIVALRMTDLRTWGAGGWLSDLIPHLVYGLVTVTALDAVGPRGPLADHRRSR